MDDNFEVITTTDKAKRDEMFEDFRTNGNELEKQAVKFSSSEPHPSKEGQYISTYSVAYPRSDDGTPTRRRRLRQASTERGDLPSLKVGK